jgi:serine protease AprX
MKILVRCFLLLLAVPCFSQQVYWVSFTEKGSEYSVIRPAEFLSGKAIARRQKYRIPVTVADLPIHTAYIEKLEGMGYTVLSRSKWLNAVAVKVPRKNDADSLRMLPFVKEVLYLGDHRPVRASREPQGDINEMLTVLGSKFDQKKQKDSVFYGKTSAQVTMLNVQELHNLGYMGQSIAVAVIDAGFHQVHRLPVFRHLLDSGRIRTTVDFVQRDSNVYDDDDHGMSVLSCMAGFMPYEFVGTAPFADYYLLRSEYSTTEMPVEETFWVEAAEYADSCGVDIINSSLGYNEFDQWELNHTHRDLNGSRTIISKGAAIAVSKGIIVVNSAGNEGNDEWGLISVPADVEEVITVGGVDAARKYALFSSTGPTADKRIKPDIMAQGDNTWVASSHGVFYQGDGTSYACPVMTGAVACLLQANYNSGSEEIRHVLQQSGDRYYQPDKYFGYGVPDVYLAHRMLQSMEAGEETLIDGRVLYDGMVHITCYTPVAGKIAITIMDEQDNQVYTGSVTLKHKGTSRVKLPKSNKLKKGRYTLQVMSGKKTNTTTFNHY